MDSAAELRREFLALHDAHSGRMDIQSDRISDAQLSIMNLRAHLQVLERRLDALVAGLAGAPGTPGAPAPRPCSLCVEACQFCAQNDGSAG